VLAAALAPAAYADLEKIRADSNLERRSRLALAHAEEVIKSARAAYESGDMKRTQAVLDEVLASVELAEKALRETGKNARKKPKHFKHAEMETRDLLRRIDALENLMSVEDRGAIQKLKTRIHEIHDDLLAAIMGEKK
jgi:hypothetical protein